MIRWFGDDDKGIGIVSKEMINGLKTKIASKNTLDAGHHL